MRRTGACARWRKQPGSRLDDPPHLEGFQPPASRIETFKLSTDPLFVEKVRDIVGLYLSPPEHALVLCVDEKNQIQALDCESAPNWDPS
jgi:hypothetical protein